MFRSSGASPGGRGRLPGSAVTKPGVDASSDGVVDVGELGLSDSFMKKRHVCLC